MQPVGVDIPSAADVRGRVDLRADGPVLALMPRVGRVLTPRVVISLNCRESDVRRRPVANVDVESRDPTHIGGP